LAWSLCARNPLNDTFIKWLTQMHKGQALFSCSDTAI
jgi:hypothetical protein